MLRKFSTWSSFKIRMQGGHNIKTNNSSSERVEQFKYLQTTVMNQNSIHKKIRSRLKSGGNASYHWVQNLLSSSLLSKNIKIKIY